MADVDIRAIENSASLRAAVESLEKQLGNSTAAERNQSQELMAAKARHSSLKQELREAEAAAEVAHRRWVILSVSSLYHLSKYDRHIVSLSGNMLEIKKLQCEVSK